MRIDVLTLFKEYYKTLDIGIIKNALKEGLFYVNVYDIREYSTDKHKKCDDYAYGGGAGMLMTPEPIYNAINAVDSEHKAMRIYMSPRGITLDDKLVKKLVKSEHLLILSGSYEGVDQRIIDNFIDMEISVGDYVLTSGDLPALTLINALSRHIEGVLGSSDSLNEESFTDFLLEYPQYTRPENFMGYEVPKVLLSGDHKKIAEWRATERISITKKIRPDLYKKYTDNIKGLNKEVK